MKSRNLILNTVMSLTIVSLLSLSTAFAKGGESGGGGFTNYLPTKWIQKSSEQLAAVIPTVPSSYFNAPDSRATVLEAIKNVKISPKVSRQRNGDELLLDYDLTSKRIEVLKGFFDKVSIGSKEEDLIPVIRDLLLHETGHLIGLIDDDDAEDFAQSIEDRMVGIPFEFTLTQVSQDKNDPWTYNDGNGFFLTCDDSPASLLHVTLSKRLAMHDHQYTPLLLMGDKNECEMRLNQMKNIQQTFVVVRGVYRENPEHTGLVMAINSVEGK